MGIYHRTVYDSNCRAMTNTGSPLLNVPTKLRLQIWDLVLSPSLSTKSRHDSGYQLTTLYGPCDTTSGVKWKHKLNGHECGTRWSSTTSPYEQLSPQILYVCRSVYEEALPTPYHERIFKPVSVKWYLKDGDYALDCWSLMNRWAQQLSTKAMLSIRAIALPHVLDSISMANFRTCISSISRQLTELQLVDVVVQFVPHRTWPKYPDYHGR